MSQIQIPQFAPIEPTTESGYRFRWLAPRDTPSTFLIGNMHFQPDETDISSAALALLDAVEASDLSRLERAMEALGEVLRLPEAWSRPSHRARDHDNFLPHNPEALGGLMAILVHGKARRARTDIVMQSDDAILPDALRSGPLVEDLHRHEGDILAELKMRRGNIGKPVEDFWVAASTLGMAPDATMAHRYYSPSKFVPKLQLAEHLVHVEQQPLLDQIQDMINQDCRGIIWAHSSTGNVGDTRDPLRTGSDQPPTESIKGQYLHVHLEALTFEHPAIVRDGLRDINRQLITKGQEMLVRHLLQ